MGIVDTAKEVVTLVQKLDNVDLLRQIMNLQMEAMTLFEDNRTLKARCQQLEEAARFSGELSFDGKCYNRVTASGTELYCSRSLSA